MRIFSKLKLVIVLKKQGLWGKFKTWLESADLWDYFDAANDLREDNEQFVAAIAAAKTALEVTDNQIEAILSQCISDSE